MATPSRIRREGQVKETPPNSKSPPGFPARRLPASCSWTPTPPTQQSKVAAAVGRLGTHLRQGRRLCPAGCPRGRPWQLDPLPGSHLRCQSRTVRPRRPRCCWGRISPPRLEVKKTQVTPRDQHPEALTVRASDVRVARVTGRRGEERSGNQRSSTSARMDVAQAPWVPSHHWALPTPSPAGTSPPGYRTSRPLRTPGPPSRPAPPHVAGRGCVAGRGRGGLDSRIPPGRPWGDTCRAVWDLSTGTRPDATCWGAENRCHRSSRDRSQHPGHKAQATEWSRGQGRTCSDSPEGGASSAHCSQHWGSSQDMELSPRLSSGTRSAGVQGSEK